MRKFVLIAAMVMASASAKAGDSRSLSTGTIVNDQPATISAQPANTSALRAENTTTTTTTTTDQPAETPRYIAPAADTTTGTQAPAETPRYTARPAPVESRSPSTTTQAPSDETASRGGRRHARSDRPRMHGRWTTGRIIATLHRYGVYW
jgi:hypothetical protein